jgi:hypothetical protein
MSLKAKQNAEVYTTIIESGKALLQLYIELKEENKQLKEIVGVVTEVPPQKP